MTKREENAQSVLSVTVLKNSWKLMYLRVIAVLINDSKPDLILHTVPVHLIIFKIPVINNRKQCIEAVQGSYQHIIADNGHAAGICQFI